MNPIANDIKYRQTSVVNFTINQLNHGQKKMLQKCIQDIMKENLVLLKDSLQL